MSIEVRVGIRFKGRGFASVFVEQGDDGVVNGMVIATVALQWLKGNPAQDREREARLADFALKMLADLGADQGIMMGAARPLNEDGTVIGGNA